MAKRGRLPGAYSGESLSTIVSAGAGDSTSGQSDMNISDYWDSTATRKNYMNLSSSLPNQVVPLSKLTFTEKNKWLLKLTMELDNVRTLQKRLDLHTAHVATVVSSSRLQPLGQNMIPCNRGAKNKGTFSLVSRKKCENLLKKLMSHRHGRIFNKPVDIVEYGVPDYYNVIKNPMDFGTIKEKLGSCKYSSPLDFLADVRLTFTNAMTYNPPGNQVHARAEALSKFFEQRWKPIESNLPVNEIQQERVLEEMDLAKEMPPSKKSKTTMVMNDEEKNNLSRDLEVHLENLPNSIIEFLRDHASNGNDTDADEIEFDVHDLDNDSLLKLRKMLDEHVQDEQSHPQMESSVIVEYKD